MKSSWALELGSAFVLEIRHRKAKTENDVEREEATDAHTRTHTTNDRTMHDEN